MNLETNIAYNSFKTITIGELLQQATDKVKKEISTYLKLNDVKLSDLFFELGCKVEIMNTHPKSKNITHSKDFWSWFNLEFCRLSYLVMNDLPKEIKLNKVEFIASFEGFFITKTIKEDLTELIKKRFL